MAWEKNLDAQSLQTSGTSRLSKRRRMEIDPLTWAVIFCQGSAAVSTPPSSRLHSRHLALIEIRDATIMKKSHNLPGLNQVAKYWTIRKNQNSLLIPIMVGIFRVGFCTSRVSALKLKMIYRSELSVILDLQPPAIAWLYLLFSNLNEPSSYSIVSADKQADMFWSVAKYEIQSFPGLTLTWSIFWQLLSSRSHRWTWIFTSLWKMVGKVEDKLSRYRCLNFLLFKRTLCLFSESKVLPWCQWFCSFEFSRTAAMQTTDILRLGVHALQSVIAMAIIGCSAAELSSHSSSPYGLAIFTVSP